MKKFILFLIALFFCTGNLIAQVGINADGGNPHGSAMLDVKSINKGVLVPRFTQVQRTSISSPATGLIIFQTDNNPGFYYFNGSNWVAVGSEVIDINGLIDGKTGGYSVFLGSGAGVNDNGSVNRNVAIGTEALYANISGYDNSATGYRALYSNITGRNNTANGCQAMYSNTTGRSNTANGYGALHLNTSGNFNTANGYMALYQDTSGYNNTANGYQSLFSNRTGYNNTALGHSSLYFNSTGNQNTASGNYSLYQNTTGVNNTVSGMWAAYCNTSGNNNTAIGYEANTSNQQGSNNTIIGYQSGSGTSLHNKSGNVFLGYQAGFSEQGNNKLYIENSNSIKPLIYGKFDSDLLTVYGNLGLGDTVFGLGSQTLALFNGIVPTASVTNGVLLYSEDVSSLSELKVRDESGFVTTLSPHNFSMVRKSEPMAWAFYSENYQIGQKINVDMLRVVRLVEEISGEKLVRVRSLDTDFSIDEVEESHLGIIQDQKDEIETLKRLTEAQLRSIETLTVRIEKLEKTINHR